MSFNEMYAPREEERQKGFRSGLQKKQKKETPSRKETRTEKVIEVEVKVGIASLVDDVFKVRRGEAYSVTLKFFAVKEEITLSEKLLENTQALTRPSMGPSSVF